MRIDVGVPIIVNAGHSLAVGFVRVEVHGLWCILALAAVERKTNCQEEARSGRGQASKHKQTQPGPERAPADSKPQGKMGTMNTTLGPGICGGALRAWLGLL